MSSGIITGAKMHLHKIVVKCFKLETMLFWILVLCGAKRVQSDCMLIILPQGSIYMLLAHVTVVYENLVNSEDRIIAREN